MKTCQAHWDMYREAIKLYGMEDLIAKNGQEAASRLEDESRNGRDSANFEPLMGMDFHFAQHALQAGGLRMMGQNEDGSNEGHYCPICEFTKNAKNFDPKTEIENIAKQMAVYAREQGLIPPLA